VAQATGGTLPLFLETPARLGEDNSVGSEQFSRSPILIPHAKDATAAKFSDP